MSDNVGEISIVRRRTQSGPYLGANNFTVKVKVWTLAIAPLIRVRLVTSSALQSRKWQLTGMSQWCRSALCRHLLPALTDNWTHGAASRHTIAPISHTRLSPLSRSYYSHTKLLTAA